MNKIKFGIIILPIILSWIVTSKTPDCKKVRIGEFYFYPPDNRGPYKLVRKDSLQYEINQQTNDTSIWKLQWLSDCLVKSSFISATNELPGKMIDFLKTHSAYLEILNVTEKYYCFQITADSIPPELIHKDTAWFNPK